MNLQRKLSYLEHAKTDSKLIWVALIAIGYLTGGISDVSSLLYPLFDSRYATIEQLENIKCDCQDLPSDLPPSVVPVDPSTGMITPKVIGEKST